MPSKVHPAASLTVVAALAFLLAAGHEQPLLAAPVPARAVDPLGDPLPEGAAQRLGTVRFRSGGMPSSMAASPDGKLVATASTIPYVCIFDMQTGRILHRLEHKHALGAVAVLLFSPDSKILYTQSHEIISWDLATGKRLQVFGGSGAVCHAAALSPDGATLALTFAKPVGKSEGGGTLWEAWIELRDAKKDKFIRSFGRRLLNFHNYHAWSADGKALFHMHWNGVGGQLIRYDPATGKERSVLNLGNCHSMPQFSADCKTLAFWVMGQGIIVWDVEKAILPTIPVNGQFSACFALSPDGNSLAFPQPAKGVTNGLGQFTETEPPRVVLWDVRKNERIRYLEYENQASPMVFTPDGKTILGTTTWGVVRKWDVATGNLIAAPDGHDGDVRSLAWSPDGKMLSTVGGDNTMRFWDTKTGKSLHTIRGAHPFLTAFAHDGKLAIAGSYRRWQFVDTATGKAVEGFDVEGEVNRFATSPDGKTLIALTSPKGQPWLGGAVAWNLQQWDLAKRQKTGEQSGDFQAMVTLAYSADGKRLAGVKVCPQPGMQDKYVYTVFVWNLETGKVEQELGNPPDAVNHLFFSKDGRTLISGSYRGLVQFWDIATGKERMRIHHEKPYPFNFHMSVSPDGKTVATADHGDDTIMLWDGATGKQLKQVKGHLGYIQCVSFSPDSRFLASGSNDTTVLVWDVQRLLRE